ncbi:MAG: thioredoxin [Candidatus Bathyarchaeia archaeon]
MSEKHRPSPKPLNLTDQNFRTLLENSGRVIVDFWADWCAPCRIMLPVFERLAEKYGHTAVFARLDVDEYPEVAASYGVYSIPTFIMFVNGKPADRVVGAVGERGMEAFVLKHISDG